MRRGNDHTIDTLIEALQDCRDRLGGDVHVHFGYEYGDRANSVVASPVRVLNEEFVEPSDYVRDFVVREYQNDEETRECVLVLSSERLGS